MEVLQDPSGHIMCHTCGGLIKGTIAKQRGRCGHCHLGYNFSDKSGDVRRAAAAVVFNPNVKAPDWGSMFRRSGEYELPKPKEKKKQ
jgi:hypothetical protein